MIELLAYILIAIVIFVIVVYVFQQFVPITSPVKDLIMLILALILLVWCLRLLGVLRFN